jgi:7,8-dihydropterin-6-yl-methyl-4-(beta-D-ribofuranosyl)aminobenzene 5'-phosphate synthase
MKITTVCDNTTLDKNLRSGWGFACWVETEETTTLFDTGGDGARFLENVATLDLDMQSIDAVALSHAHGDHTGGLAALLNKGVRPTVYVPRSFPQRFKADVSSLTRLVEVGGPTEIRPRIYTTGELGRGIVEQALAVETLEGLVVITGCAHPGVVKMVRAAKAIGKGEVALVMGGFHLGGVSRKRINRIIADFRDLGVQRVAPCHCTGQRAMNMFASAFGENYIRNGVGRVITVNAAKEGIETRAPLTAHL